MAIQLFILGLITLLGQVVLMRELIVAFFGVELIYVPVCFPAPRRTAQTVSTKRKEPSKLGLTKVPKIASLDLVSATF